MPDRIGTIRRGFLIPADDLNLEFLRAGYYGLGDDIALTLSLLYGIGPNAPRLITVDDSGRLILGTSPGLIGPVQIADGVNSSLLADVQAISGAPAVGSLGLNTQALLSAWGPTAPRFVGVGGAAAMLAAISNSALQVTNPGNWSVVSNPAAGVQATATKAAGGAGVRHICSSILVTWGAIAAPVATALTWALRDGATGVGTILAQGQLAVPAAAFQGQSILLTDMAIVGTGGTAMTLEFSAALANLLEGVTLIGFDAS